MENTTSGHDSLGPITSPHLLSPTGCRKTVRTHRTMQSLHFTGSLVLTGPRKECIQPIVRALNQSRDSSSVYFNQMYVLYREGIRAYHLRRAPQLCSIKRTLAKYGSIASAAQHHLLPSWSPSACLGQIKHMIYVVPVRSSGRFSMHLKPDTLPRDYMSQCVDLRRATYSS